MRPEENGNAVETKGAGCNSVAEKASPIAAVPAPKAPAQSAAEPFLPRVEASSAGPRLPYFEHQVKRWCGLHCLNALEQHTTFDKKQLKAFADELFLLLAAIEDNTAAEGRRGRTGRVRAPASHAFGSAVEGNLDVQVKRLLC